MNRRKFLTYSSSATVISLSGCLDIFNGDDDNGNTSNGVNYSTDIDGNVEITDVEYEEPNLSFITMNRESDIKRLSLRVTLYNDDEEVGGFIDSINEMEPEEPYRFEFEIDEEFTEVNISLEMMESVNI